MSRVVRAIKGVTERVWAVLLARWICSRASAVRKKGVQSPCKGVSSCCSCLSVVDVREQPKPKSVPFRGKAR